MSKIPTITAASIVLPVCLAGLVGCDNRPLPIVETAPEVLPWTASPRVEAYRKEFHGKSNSIPSVPALGEKIQGKVLHCDFNSVDSVWSIVTHAGTNWYADQRLYLQFQKPERSIQITAFAQEVLNDAYALRPTEPERPLVVVSVAAMKGAAHKDAIWLLDGEVRKRVSSGSRLVASPDHTKFIFLRMGREGFHSLYLWEGKEAQPRCFLSLWEADPGSGTSWNCAWAADSGAVRVEGSCGGFLKRQGEAQEIDLVYILDERKMYSLK